MRERLTLTGVVVGIAAVAALGVTAPAVAAPAAAKPKVSSVHIIAGKVYAEGVACPSGKPATKENCDVVGDTSAGTNVISVVHHGKPGGLTTVTPGGGTITCPSAKVCVVAGAETSTGPGGAVGTLEWLTTGAPSVTVEVTGTNDLTGVACPSPTRCVAAGYFNGKSTATSTKQYGEVAIVNSNETTVHAHRVAKTDTLSGVGCGSATKCVVVGFGGPNATHHAVVVDVSKGHIGSARSAPGAGQLNDISCGTATTCWATGEHSSAKGRISTVVVKVSKGKPKHALGGPEDVGGISCVTATTCYLGGGKLTGSGQNSTGEVFRLVSGHVKSKRLIKHTMGFSSIACPTTSSCIVTGTQSFHNPGPSSYWRSDVAVLKV
jgi:hypothetical protein